MINPRILLLSVLASVLSMGALAQNRQTESVGDTLHFAVRNSLYQNPVTQYYHYKLNTDNVFVSVYDRHESRPLLVEKGDGISGKALRAWTYRSISANVKVWGSASYDNYTRKNVRWNENADYDMVAPFLMGDSIGGDLKGENYMFSGGWAYDKGAYTLGVEASCRALLEYRNRDPRPRNSVVDISLKIGGAYAVSKDYKLFVGGYLRKYKQNSDIEYYSLKGSTSVYHETGLGTDYARFAGSNDATYYQGWAVGANVGLLPINVDGWSVFVDYKHFMVHKILTSAGDLPLNDLDRDFLSGEISWLHRWRSYVLGFRMFGGYVQGEGNEHIFGSPQSGIYPEISVSDIYKRRDIVAGISGEIVRRWKSSRVELSPFVRWESSNEKYLLPLREINYDHLSVGSSAAIDYQMKKTLWVVKSTLSHVFASKGVFNLSGLSATSDRYQSFSDNYLYNSHDHSQISVLLHWNHPVTSSYKFYAQSSYALGIYTKNVTTRTFEFNVGLLF